MNTIKLTDQLSFSRVAQGFWRLDSWDFSTDQLVDFMNFCIDKGVTTFDTAEIYADTLCETLMGAAFKADPTIRQKIQLVTKTGIYKNGDFGYYNTSYDRVVQSCHESLERLNVDSIDLYLIHREDPCFDPWETGRALLDLKNQGLVKEIGVSNFDPFKFDALNTAVGGELVTNQIEVNPFCFEHFNSGMIDLLAKEKIHPMIWSPLAGGDLFKEGEPYSEVRQVLEPIAKKHNTEISTIVYAWLMYHPAGFIPISGSNKPERLQQALDALEITLEHEEWYRIYVASGQQILR